MVEGCGKIVKFLMFVSNFIIFLAGLAILGLGIWTLVDKSFVERLLDSHHYITTAVVLIVVGAIVAIISLIGTIGAYKEVRCLLIAFFVILLMILLVLIASGVLAFVYRNQVDEKMRSELTNSISLYGDDPDITNAWDFVQRSFNCCGVVENNQDNKKTFGYSAWLLNNRFRDPSSGQSANSQPAPWSCCKSNAGKGQLPDENNRPGCATGYPQTVHQDECFLKIKDYIGQHAIVLGVLGIAVAAFLILGMAFSCALCCMIK